MTWDSNPGKVKKIFIYSIKPPTPLVSGLIPGVKPPGREIYHSLPPNAEEPVELHICCPICPHGVHRNIFRNVKRKIRRSQFMVFK